jgi:hypothetical protein
MPRLVPNRVPQGPEFLCEGRSIIAVKLVCADGRKSSENPQAVGFPDGDKTIKEGCRDQMLTVDRCRSLAAMCPDLDIFTAEFVVHDAANLRDVAIVETSEKSWRWAAPEFAFEARSGQACSMYTVLRITGSGSVTQTAADAINAVSPGTMTPRYFRKDGHSGDVCELINWYDHADAIEEFVVAHHEALAAAAASGANIEFDTGIYPDDPWLGDIVTVFGIAPSLHRQLGAIGASLALSWYP